MSAFLEFPSFPRFRNFPFLPNLRLHPFLLLLFLPCLLFAIRPLRCLLTLCPSGCVRIFGIFPEKFTVLFRFCFSVSDLVSPDRNLPDSSHTCFSCTLLWMWFFLILICLDIFKQEAACLRKCSFHRNRTLRDPVAHLMIWSKYEPLTLLWFRDH